MYSREGARESEKGREGGRDSMYSTKRRRERQRGREGEKEREGE